MKIINFLKFTVAILLIVAISVILHEFVHFIQYHYIYGVPYSYMEMHFIWEITDISKYTILNFPIAWVSASEYNSTVTVSKLAYNSFEPVAYTIQYSFIFLSYRYIYRNKQEE